MCPLNCFKNVCDPFSGYCEKCVKGYDGVMCEKLSSLRNSSRQSRENGERVSGKSRSTSTGGDIAIYTIVVLLSCILPAVVFYFCIKFSIQNLRHARFSSEEQSKSSQTPIYTISNLRGSHRQPKKYQRMEVIEEESGIHEVTGNRNDLHVHFDEPSRIMYSAGGRNGAESSTATSTSWVEPFKHTHLDFAKDGVHLSTDQGYAGPASVYGDFIGTCEQNRTKDTPLLQLNDSVHQWDTFYKISPSYQLPDTGSGAKRAMPVRDHKRRTPVQSLLREREELLFERQGLDHNQGSKNAVSQLSPGAYTVHDVLGDISLGENAALRNKCCNSMETCMTQERVEQQPEYLQLDVLCTNGHSGDVVISESPLVGDCSKLGKKPHVTTSQPIIGHDRATMIYKETNQLLNAGSYSNNKLVSKTNRFMELLRMKRMLNFSMETWKPTVNDHLDSNYNDHGGIGAALDVDSAECKIGENVESKNGQSCSLNVVPQIEDDMSIEGVYCNSSKISVNVNDMKKTNVNKQTGHTVMVARPGNVSFVPDQQEENYCLAAAPLEIRGHDIKECSLDVSAVEVYGYNRLTLTTNASCAMEDRDLFQEEINIENTKSIPNSHIDEHQDTAAGLDYNPMLCTDHARSPHNCSLINGTTNNTSGLQVQSVDQQSSFSVSSFSCLQEASVLSHQIFNESQQMKYLLPSENVSGQTAIPLLSITNSTPMKLSIRCCIKDGTSQSLPCGSQPTEQSTVSSVLKNENVVTHCFQPSEISLMVPSPPKYSQRQQFSALSTTTSRKNTNDRKWTSLNKHSRDERLNNGCTCREDNQFQCMSQARRDSRVRGFLSPSKAISRFKMKRSLISNATKYKTNLHNCRKQVSKSSDRHANKEKGNDKGTSAFSFIPIPCGIDTNLQRRNKEPGCQDKVTQKSSIKMTVDKTPSRDVVATFPTSSDRRTEAMSTTASANIRQDGELSRINLSENEFRKLNISNTGPTERFRRRRSCSYCKEKDLAISGQPCRDGNISIRTPAVANKPSHYRSYNPTKVGTEECLTDDTRYRNRKISLLASSSKMNNSADLGFRLDDGGYSQHISAGNENIQGTADVCTDNLKIDTETTQKPSKFQIHKHTSTTGDKLHKYTSTTGDKLHKYTSTTGDKLHKYTSTTGDKLPKYTSTTGDKLHKQAPVSEDSTVLKLRLDKAMANTEEEQSNIEHHCVAEKAIQTEIVNEKNRSNLPLKYQNIRRVQSNIYPRPCRGQLASSSRGTDTCTENGSLKLDSDEQKNPSPPRQEQLPQQANPSFLSVYPLPSILEEVAMSENTGSTETESSEVKPSKDCSEEIITSCNSEQAEMKCSEQVNFSRKYELSRPNLCRRESEIWSSFSSENGKRRNNSSINLQNEGRRQTSESSVKSSQSLKLQHFQRGDERKQKSFIYHDSKRDKKDSPEIVCDDRKDITEYESVPEDCTECFYDALEHLTSTAPLSGSSRHRKHSQYLRKGIKDRKPGIQFDRNLSERRINMDNSLRKKHDSAESMMSTNKDTKHQAIICNAERTTKNKSHISFRFASRNKNDGDVSVNTEKTVKHTIGVRKRTEAKQTTSKHLYAKQYHEVYRNSHNLTYAEVTAETTSQISVSEHKQQHIDYYSNIDGSDNSFILNPEERDLTVYSSLHSEKDHSFGDVQCSPVEDFFSIRDI